MITGVPTFEDETDEDLRSDQLMLIKQHINSGSTFKSIFHELKHTLDEAILYQDVPFDKMAGQLRLNYNANHLPIIHTVVSLEQIHSDGFIETAAADALFQFAMGEDLIDLKLCFNEQVYDRQYMMQVLGHLNRLFSVILFQPDLPSAKWIFCQNRRHIHFSLTFKLRKLNIRGIRRFISYSKNR